MEIKKILVPLDGSPESEKAFTFGLDLAEKYDARLVLAHVVDMNEKMTALDQVTMSGYVPSEILDEGYRLLSRSARKVPPHIQLDTMVRIGAPPQTLLSMAGRYRSGSYRHGKPGPWRCAKHRHGQREPVYPSPCQGHGDHSEIEKGQ